LLAAAAVEERPLVVEVLVAIVVLSLARVLEVEQVLSQCFL
jgi:hypothetical protein